MRSGRLPPGHSNSAASAPSVTSQCRLSRRSSAGGRCGRLLPSGAGDKRRDGRVGERAETAPRVTERCVTSTSACAHLVPAARELAPMPSASRVPSRLARQHAERIVDPQRDVRALLRQLRFGQRDEEQRGQQRAASPRRVGRPAFAGGGALAAAPARGPGATRARRAAAARRDAASESPAAAASPSNHNGVTKLSNWIAPGPGVAAACAARAARRPSR